MRFEYLAIVLAYLGAGVSIPIASIADGSTTAVASGSIAPKTGTTGTTGQFAAKTETAPPNTTAKSAAGSGQSSEPTGAGHRAALDPIEDKHLRALGYVPEVRSGGVIFYCRRETTLGSRFEEKICMTAAQHTELQQDSRNLTDALQRSQISPAGK